MTTEFSNVHSVTSARRFAEAYNVFKSPCVQLTNEHIFGESAEVSTPGAENTAIKKGPNPRKTGGPAISDG